MGSVKGSGWSAEGIVAAGACVFGDDGNGAAGSRCVGPRASGDGNGQPGGHGRRRITAAVTDLIRGSVQRNGGGAGIRAGGGVPAVDERGAGGRAPEIKSRGSKRTDGKRVICSNTYGSRGEQDPDAFIFLMIRRQRR